MERAEESGTKRDENWDKDRGRDKKRNRERNRKSDKKRDKEKEIVKHTRRDLLQNLCASTVYGIDSLKSVSEFDLIMCDVFELAFSGNLVQQLLKMVMKCQAEEWKLKIQNLTRS